MPGEIVNSAKNILNYVNELKKTDNLQKKKELLGRIDLECSKIYGILITENNQKQVKKVYDIKLDKSTTLPKPQIVLPKEKTIPSVVLEQDVVVNNFSSTRFRNLTKEEKKKFIKELSIDQEELKSFIKFQKMKRKGKVSKIIGKKDYNIYQPSSIGKTANRFMKKYADKLVAKYPKFFEPLFWNFKMVEMELLSRTYVSMMLFFTLLSFPLIFLFFLALNFAFHLSILLILIISFFGMIFTFFAFYLYPASLIGGKNKKIKLEYPFALVHMSAVAGSGAHPISIFELIAESDDYPELRKEVKKIMNYVNLFGYNLTNALRNVAATTPNPEFKELLNGMMSTIETGGDIKQYLKEKAEDALNTYKLDRKKQVEALATYSEIYTAILIASPLLLLVTLAIINSIGGGFGGLSVITIAWLGILGALPLLNIGFMVFITASQKGI